MTRFVPSPVFTLPYVLRGVDLWNSDGVRRKVKLSVRAGILERIQPDDTSASGDSYVVLPSGVDTQVHLRVPGQLQKETAATGILAALAGGVGAFVTMPNTRPVIDEPSILLRAQDEVRSSADAMGVLVLFSAAATLGQKGQRVAALEALAKQGACAFTDDGRAVADPSVLSEVFERLSALGVPFFQHAEREGHGGRLAHSPTQKALSVPAYLPEEEISMVARDVALLRKYPQARYHLLHVSTPESVRLIAEARTEGLHATCEVTPHHLWFDDDCIDSTNTSFLVNPPLRTRAGRDDLRIQLQLGEIGWVATDHAPHEPTAKDKGFAKSAFGTTGLETSLRVLLALYREGGISEGRLVEVFSRAPSHFLSLSDFGSLREGMPFRAVVVPSPRETALVSGEDLYSLSKNNCFLGSRLPRGPMLHHTAKGLFGDIGEASTAGVLEVSE